MTFNEIKDLAHHFQSASDDELTKIACNLNFTECAIFIEVMKTCFKRKVVI